MIKSRKRKTNKKRLKTKRRKGGWDWPFTRKNNYQETPKTMEEYRKMFLTCRGRTLKGRFLRRFYKRSCAQLLLDEKTSKDLKRCILYAIVMYFSNKTKSLKQQQERDRPFQRMFYKFLPDTSFIRVPYPTPVTSEYFETILSYDINLQKIPKAEEPLFHTIFQQIANQFTINTTLYDQSIHSSPNAQYAPQALTALNIRQPRKEEDNDDGATFAYEYVKDDSDLYTQVIRDIMIIYFSHFQVKKSKKVTVHLDENESVLDFIEPRYPTMCKYLDMVCFYFSLFRDLKIPPGNLPSWVNVPDSLEPSPPPPPPLSNEHSRQESESLTPMESVTPFSPVKYSSSVGKGEVDEITPPQERSTKKKKTVVNSNKKKLVNPIRYFCGDVGICLSLNSHTSLIMQMFDNFQDFKYLESSPRIISTMVLNANGFVRLLKYQRTVEKQPFYSYGIFKTSLWAYADNLMYEYEVGNKCVNHLCKYYPIFAQTYGIYLRSSSPNVFGENIEVPNRAFTKYLKKLEGNKVSLRYICKSTDLLCLVGQYYNNFISFRRYIDFASVNDSLRNNLPFFLFQLYYSLHQCRKNFTHYDLHSRNFGVVPLQNNMYIQYQYVCNSLEEGGDPVVLEFKSEYIVKLLDYGRSFFFYDNVSSTTLMKAARDIGECSSTYFNNNKQQMINNQRADLILLSSFREDYTFNALNEYPGFQELIRKMKYNIFMNYTLTRDDRLRPEKPFNPDPNEPIYNVSDACYKFTQYLLTNTDNVININMEKYQNFQCLGTLRVYPNIEKQMEFHFSPREQQEPIFENLNL
jgi:hypothetical protein